MSKQWRINNKLRGKTIACVCTWQTSALLNISQIPGSISSVLQTHSGKHCPSPVPPVSRSSLQRHSTCVFFAGCIFAVERLQLPGWCIHVWKQTAAVGSCHCDRSWRMLRRGTLPRQPGAGAGGRRQLEPALFLHNLACCPQIHKKSCTLPVY